MNNIVILETKVTNNTNKLIGTLLDYLYTIPDAKLIFQKLDIILKIYSDRSYLSVINSRSRVVGYYFMGDNIPITQQDDL